MSELVPTLETRIYTWKLICILASFSHCQDSHPAAYFLDDDQSTHLFRIKSPAVVSLYKHPPMIFTSIRNHDKHLIIFTSKLITIPSLNKLDLITEINFQNQLQVLVFTEW